MGPRINRTDRIRKAVLWTLALCIVLAGGAQSASGQKPNIVMLMTDDTGWGDFGAYSGGGLSLGHPTPNVDRIAK